MKAKKLIVGILIFIAAIIMLAALSTVHAESLGYLKITKERTEVSHFHIDEEKLKELLAKKSMQAMEVSRDIETMQAGESSLMQLEQAMKDVEQDFTLIYKHQLYHNNTESTKNIWKIVACSDEKGTECQTPIKDLYCLRAGLGFATDGNVDNSSNVKEYNLSYDLISDYDALKRYFNTLTGTQITIFKEDNKDDLNAVLWILDNMLLEDASDEIAKKFVEDYAGYQEKDLTQDIFRENVLTRSDIEVIQQLAIWYFTNEEEGKEIRTTEVTETSAVTDGYHNENLPTLYVDIDEKDGKSYIYTTHKEEEKPKTDTYKTFSDIFNTKVLNDEQAGTKRQKAAETLYENLINRAKEAAENAKKNGGLYNPTRDITVYFAGTQAATEQPVVQVKEREPKVDVALRKFITEIDNKELKNDDGTFTREPKVDTSKLNDVVNGKLVTTADYNHTKQPLRVNKGSTIKYRLRIYNEGEVDVYITKLTDHLPKQLIYNEGDWQLQSEAKSAISTDNLKVVGAGGQLTDEEIGKQLSEVKIPKAKYNEDKAGTVDEYTLSYVDVEIVCKVLDTAEPGEKITNIAEITEMKDETKQKVLTNDRDSVPDGNYDSTSDDHKKPLESTTDPELEKYKDEEIKDQKAKHDRDGKWNYIPGQEDDDDFEKVYVPEPAIDLALRKFITAINGVEKDDLKDRIPDDITSSTLGAGQTTADYEHSKQPYQVNIGDIITYTIRIYNEGDVPGRVSELKDYLATYLEYVPSTEEGETPWWTQVKGETQNVLTSTEDIIAVGANISGDTAKSNAAIGKKISEIIIPAYDEEKDILSYIDVKVNCRVLPVTETTKMTNIAEITKELNEDGETPADDRDSVPEGKQEGDTKVPTGTPTEDWKDPQIEDQKQKHDEDEKWEYIPGEEDDDDFEKVVVKPKFDLALRKFITQVENTSVNNRYPTPTMKEDGNIKYVHPKDPVPVGSGNTVIYTIRVYNEGEAAGFAEEITDDYPKGLEFLVDNEVNKEYRWKMLDENEEETDDITKAKYLVTDYLSEAQGIENNRDNKIKAFNKDAALSDTNPDYRDVKIAFKVTYVPTTKEEADRIIVNEAQISKDSDDDIDSIPNRDEVYDRDENDDHENEDDIDYDNVIVKYFDLSLLKWVAKTRVTLNGETVETDTGHNAENSKNESQVKIEIPEKDLKKINIKYVYTIRVTNEGELEGYAEEIRDYIPEGLRFEEADNTEWHWKMQEDGTVTTDYFKDTLLKPGDYVEVPIILTWINDPENLGEKVNLAEISVDRTPGDTDVPDVDSTPDNKKPEEDDIDDAPVILAVKSGMANIYIGLIGIVLVTFATGVSLIKKYVLF